MCVPSLVSLSVRVAVPVCLFLSCVSGHVLHPSVHLFSERLNRYDRQVNVYVVFTPEDVKG